MARRHMTSEEILAGIENEIKKYKKLHLDIDSKLREFKSTRSNEHSQYFLLNYQSTKLRGKIECIKSKIGDVEAKKTPIEEALRKNLARIKSMKVIVSANNAMMNAKEETNISHEVHLIDLMQQK